MPTRKEYTEAALALSDFMLKDERIRYLSIEEIIKMLNNEQAEYIRLLIKKRKRKR